MIGISVGGFVVFGADDTSGGVDDEPAGDVVDPAATLAEPMPTRPEPNGPVSNERSGEVVRSSCELDTVVPRECFVFSPGDVAEGERLPAVLMLHGMSSTPQVVSAEGGWRDLLVERRFHVVAPAGFGKSWNAGPCCPPASGLEIDDVGYLQQLVDSLEDRPDVDASELHIVGVSNGGILGYRFLCSSRGRIQTLVSYAGTRLTQCAPDAPVDVLQVHGTADEVVPYDNGLSIQAAVLGVDFPPVEPTMAQFAADAGCAGGPTDEQIADRVVARRWDDCAGGRRVELDTIAGAKHIQWQAGYDVATAMVDFMGLTP